VILSRLFLNPRSRDVQRALGDSHAMHARVMSMFPVTDSPSPRAELAVLYRLERSEGADALTLLVQSKMPPDATRLPTGFLDPRAGQDAFSSKELGPLLEGLSIGSRLRFRLRANATRKIDTKSEPGGKRRNGRRVPVRGEEARLHWLTRHLAASGLRLAGSSIQRPEGTARGHASGTARMHDAHVFEGIVEVVDVDLARRAVRSGVGPAKAYGFGLLSLARA